MAHIIIYGRGEGIRTPGPMVPNQVRYQTALHLDSKKWRRRRDSNPRTGLIQPNPLAGDPLEPLEYFSIFLLLYGGEGGIRTHGAVKHHWFSRPAP